MRGITAIAITMGGYADSSFVTTSELTTYFDAQAAVEYAKEVTGLESNRILVHGLSIGGALASAAAAANPGLHCTVDQTFVNAQEIALSCAKEFSSRVPSWMVKGAVSSMFRAGITDPRLPGTSHSAIAFDTLSARRRHRYHHISTTVIASTPICATLLTPPLPASTISTVSAAGIGFRAVQLVSQFVVCRIRDRSIR